MEVPVDVDDGAAVLGGGPGEGESQQQRGARHLALTDLVGLILQQHTISRTCPLLSCKKTPAPEGALSFAGTLTTFGKLLTLGRLDNSVSPV